MGNLITELGAQFVRERFNHAMLYDDKGNPCYLETGRNWNTGLVPVTAVTGTPDKPVIEKKGIPYAFFSSMSCFKVPDLGWRMAAEGRYLAHFRKNNKMNRTGYRRGFNPNNSEITVSPATLYLQETKNLSDTHYDKLEVQTLLVMRPEYMKFDEGIRMMKEGDLFSFAVSPVIAVIPDVNQGFMIFFNTRQVAKLTNKGTLVCPNETIKTYLKNCL